LCIQERIDCWVPSSDIDSENKEYFDVVEFCRSLTLNVTNKLILKYGQDLKNEQWLLEPFADLVISFSIIDTCFKRYLSLNEDDHKTKTDRVFKLSLANHYFNSLDKAQIILEYINDSEMIEKINAEKSSLNYKPNRIKYKQDIVNDLYSHKKYYLD
jgi:hypothetical protein